MTRRIQNIKGVDYVYEPYVEWDPDRRVNVHKRRYIGKMVEGNFVPNKTYELAQQLRHSDLVGPAEIYGSSVQAQLCGLTEFLEILSRRMGISDDLEGCFPRNWKEILSLAFYLTTEFAMPLNRFHRWAQTHEHPALNDISDDAIIDLLKCIDVDRAREFLTRQVKRRAGKSVTVYAHDFFLSLQELAVLALSGADSREWPRQKLLTIYSEASGLPCGFVAAARDRADRPLSFDWLKGRLAEFGIEKPTVVSSARIFEDDVLEKMLEAGWHFICDQPQAKSFYEQHFGGLTLPSEDSPLPDWHWNERVRVYEQTRLLMRPIGCDKHGSVRRRRVWVHFYFDPAVGTTEASQSGRQTVATMMGDYADEPRTYYHTFAGGLVSRYGVRLMPNALAWASVRESGFYCLITNAKKSAFDALNAFRRQDFQYEHFSNMCERLYLRPFSYGGSEPDSVFQSQLFLQFLGLVFFEATRREHSKSGLWSEINHTNLLDELDTIQRYSQKGKGATVSKLTPYQKEIYKKLGIRPPGSGRR